jgi:hypothetical protein
MPGCRTILKPPPGSPPDAAERLGLSRLGYGALARIQTKTPMNDSTPSTNATMKLV